MLHVADSAGEVLVRFLVGTGFRIGEGVVAEWTDIDWEEKTISVRFKPKYTFKPKDYEERTIAVSDTLLACLKKYRVTAPSDTLIFPSPAKQTKQTPGPNYPRSHREGEQRKVHRQEAKEALPCFSRAVRNQAASAWR